MHTFLVEDSSKKAKDVNIFVATTSYNEYKDVLLNNKCLINLMN